MLEGNCNCGAISFAVAGDSRSVSACDCQECRRQSGGIWRSAVNEATDLRITGTPQWFRCSNTAQCGFCARCGSFLFWKHAAESSISFALGAIETPTGLTLQKHIFTAEKGDYYTIADSTVPEER